MNGVSGWCAGYMPIHRAGGRVKSILTMSIEAEGREGTQENMSAVFLEERGNDHEAGWTKSWPLQEIRANLWFSPYPGDSFLQIRLAEHKSIPGLSKVTARLTVWHAIWHTVGSQYTLLKWVNPLCSRITRIFTDERPRGKRILILREIF